MKVDDHDRSQVLDFNVVISEMLSIKMRFAMVSLLAMLLCFGASFLLPKKFSSEILVQPQSIDASMNPSDMLSGGGLGGLASLAGVDLSSGGDQIKVNIEKLQSRDFILKFIEASKHSKDIAVAAGWDADLNVIFYDDEAVSKMEALEGPKSSPLVLAEWESELYDSFLDDMSFDHKADLGLLSITYQHVSPFVAQEVLSEFLTLANSEFRKSMVEESTKKVEYLTENLKEIEVESIRNIFYQLIETELKTAMLMEVKPEFAFKVIDTPFLSHKKSSPSRAAFVFLGLGLSLCAWFFFGIYRALKTE